MLSFGSWPEREPRMGAEAPAAPKPPDEAQSARALLAFGGMFAGAVFAFNLAANKLEKAKRGWEPLSSRKV